MLGSPGAGKLPAGKYRELTLSRQRGGTEEFSPLPSFHRFFVFKFTPRKKFQKTDMGV